MFKARFENNQLCINRQFLQELLRQYRYTNEGTIYEIKFDSMFASYFIVEKMDDGYYKIVPTTSRNNERPVLQMEAYWELCKDRNVQFEGEIPLFYKQWYLNRGMLKENKQKKLNQLFEYKLRKIIRKEIIEYGKKSRLAHGNTRYNKPQPTFYPTMKKGKEVEYIGTVNPDPKFMGRRGIVVGPGEHKSMIIIQFDNNQYQMNREDLKLI